MSAASGRSSTSTRSPGRAGPAAARRRRPPAVSTTASLALDGEHDGVEEVRLPHEARHERVRRPLVERTRRRHLLEPRPSRMTATRSERSIASSWSWVTRTTVIAERPLKLAELRTHRLAERPVERAERLVHQEDARVEDERPRERDPLLLPARQLARQPVAVARQAHQLEHRVHALGHLGPGRPARGAGKATFSRTVRCGKSA